MENRFILVTGASRGIGKAIALRFARGGWNLVITCRQRHDELLRVQEEILSNGVFCHSFVGDLSSQEEIHRLWQELKEKGCAIQALINNAGICHLGLFQDLTWDEWQEIVGTNLTSVYGMCHEALPTMIQRKSGSILNISSVWGICGASCEAAYPATIGGIHALTRALAKEHAPSHIAVNAIACGAIDTEMNAFLSPQERESLLEEIPAGRMGTPEEVADLAWRLIDSSPYLTGQIISLDGGWI